jgi:predicted Zn-dependent peptidase
MTINAGSRDELPGEHGIAHLVEHSLFKGTAHRRAYHINSRLENLGGELNAFTTKEDTTVHATVLRSDFAKAAELVADIVFNSAFPANEIEREKQVVVDEINSYRDIPQEMIYDDFEAEMFAGSPLGRNILGTARSVKKFDSDMLRDFVARTYTPDCMVFAAVGDLSERTFRAIAERYFGSAAKPASGASGASRASGVSGAFGTANEPNPEVDRPDFVTTVPDLEEMEAGKRGFLREMPPPLTAFEKTVVKKGNHQSHCVLGNRAYSLTDPRRLPLMLMVNILGGPAANSRLNMVLRERNGLSYSVEAMYSPFSDSGFASIYFGCEKENLDRCRKLVDTELQRVMDSPLTPRALSAAKKQFLGQFAISMDASEGYMLGAAKSYLIYNEIDSLQIVADKIAAITADEVLTATRDVFGTLSSMIYR